MKIIIDTNILLSALIKDSVTRKILIEAEWQFFYPEMSFHEVRKHKDLVLDKSGMKNEEYIQVLNQLFQNIELIPEESIYPTLKEANDIMGKIDPDDAVFLAAALGIPNSLIWSDDSDFDKQLKVRVLKTKDVVKLF